MPTPLTTTNPLSIEELLSRDPLSLTPEDVEQNTKLLVKALRKEREIWEQEKTKAKLTGKKVAGGTTKKLQKQAVLEALNSGSAKIDLGSIMSTPKGKGKGR